jgi:hypothetical protein
MLATFGLSLALLTSGVQPPGPCDLLTREAAGQLLGQQVTTMTPSGPEPDEDTGGTRTVCLYQAGTRMLVLIRVAFANPAAARQATTKELVTERLEEDGYTITEEPTLGDMAFWAHSPRGAQYIVVKGAAVLGLALGGMPREPSTYRAQLRAVTVAATAKL